MMFFAMANPSPKPVISPFRRILSVELLLNLSKIFNTISGDMPTPLSETDIRHQRPPSDNETDIMPPLFLHIFCEYILLRCQSRFL